jgi:hypothetical protein
MTWYSRLLQKDRRASLRASNRRRRTVDLERLETRTVLSNVTVTFPAPGTSSTLLIQGDTGNDNIAIMENGDGSVTVAPGTLAITKAGVIPGSSINGNSAAVGTNNPVSAIIVQLPGTTNFDIVNLNGTSPAASPTVGNVSVSAVGANLTFNVDVNPNPTGFPAATPVHNSGALTVSDIASTPTDGVLLANIQNSSFGSMAITQYGNGPDFSSVRLANDTVPGAVSVSLGNANGDTITLLNNPAFGPTTLLEGAGGPAIPTGSPAVGTSSGNNDTITVSGPATGGTSHYTSLYAQQDVTLAGGTHETISISNIQVAYIASTTPNPAGVTTIQGNGAFDTTTITGVTTYGPSIPINSPIPGTGFAAISVTQGNGNVGLVVNPNGAVNDQASVTNSTVPGNISISQAGLASNSPMYNTALISNDKSTYGNLSITQANAGGVVLKTGVTPGDQATITGSTAGGNATITQGTGINDSAAILSSTVGGSDTITQADQSGNPGDTARIVGGTAGGSATITQGGGTADSAIINLTSIGGSATITQGGGAGDTATIVVTTVKGNATITQGDVNGDIAVIDPVTTTGTVGGNASITQGNGNGDVGVISFLTIGGSVTVTQGNGNGDAGEIENVASTGGTDKAPIVISVTQGNGNNDIAAIVNLTATGGTAATPIPISITQGSGNADWAEIANVTAPNANITITQTDVATNPNGDTALVLNSAIGTTGTGPDGTLNDFNGNITITQGSAPGDVALVEGTFAVAGTANNITITQGSNGGVNGTLPGFNGSSVAADVAEINDEVVTSNITVTQGNANSFGYNVTAIGYDYVGQFGLVTLPTTPPQFTALVVPSTGSSFVTAGGVTAIQQFGGNNQIFLGDASDYFYSTFLNVYTGAGGGSFVMAQNTYTFGAAALGGPFSSVYSIAGGGSGNLVYLDPNSIYYVTFDPGAFVGFA